MESQSSFPSSSQKEDFVNTSKRLLENKNWTFPNYFKWKLEFFSNILSLVVDALKTVTKKVAHKAVEGTSEF